MLIQAGKFSGRWTKTSGNLSTSLALVSTWTVDETPNGISESSGTFTITKAGQWLLVANVVGPSAATTLTAAHLGTSTTAWWAAHGPMASAAANKCSLTTVKRFTLNDTFGLYVQVGSAAAPANVAGGFNLSATWIGA